MLTIFLEDVKDFRRPQDQRYRLHHTLLFSVMAICCNANTYVCKGSLNTVNSMRLLLPSKPVQTLVTDNTGKTLSMVKSSWDENSKTFYLGFDNSPGGIKVNIKW